ncbi:hypothetical protein GE09DRAFT_263460 [Coniochaeta sp. 2T2.1]|nr:hypothetical protein GE09DRAFT_263460 [Coniochaeta sp. 2T2.1]
MASSYRQEAADSGAADAGPQLSKNIRTFSFEVEAEMRDSEAGKALVNHVAEVDEQDLKKRQDELRWRRWWGYESIGGSELEIKDDAELLDQCMEVTRAWKDFNKSSVFKKAKFPDVDETRPPSIETLQTTVKETQLRWAKERQTRWGVARANLVAFAEKLNAHKALFSFFPSENIYTSVLCGTISTVLTACASYEAVAQTFTKAILDIGGYFHSVQQSGKVFDSFVKRTRKELDTPEIRRAVARAYVPVFKFLGEALQWHSSRRHRLMASLNSRFSEENVKQHVEDVKRLADYLHNAVNQAISDNTNQVVHKIMQDVSDREESSDKLRHLSPKEIGIQISTARWLGAGQVGRQVARMLMSTEKQHDYSHDVLLVIPNVRRSKSVEPVSGAPSGDGAVEAAVIREVLGLDEQPEADKQRGECNPNEGSSTTSRHYARAEIKDRAQQLSTFAENGKDETVRSFASSPHNSIPHNVLADIQRWLKLTTSALLWVEGPGYASDLSPTALRVCIVTSDAGIPCISFFDKRRYRLSSTKGLTYPEAGLISLLHSLISQLINTLPVVFHTDDTFEDEDFSHLDGSPASIDSALDMIRKLLLHAPPVLMCVIDGIQAFDTKELRPHIRRLVDILRDQGTRTVVKAMFTTDGMSRALAKKIKLRERVNASEMENQERPGSPSKGYSSLSVMSSPRERPRSMPPSRG